MKINKLLYFSNTLKDKFPKNLLTDSEHQTSNYSYGDFFIKVINNSEIYELYTR